MSAIKHQKPDSEPPTYLHHQGREWSYTGKTGTHCQTDANGAADEVQHEYEALDNTGTRTGARAWRTLSGHIYSED
jgi:hypothetical protein